MPARSRRGGSRVRSQRTYTRKHTSQLPFGMASVKSLKSLYPSTKRLEAKAKKEIHRVARLARGNSISSVESVAKSSARGIRSLTSAFEKSFTGSLGKVVSAAKSIKKATRKSLRLTK